MTPLTDIGEDALIARLTRGLRSRADVVTGVGDDCAVVRPAGSAGHDWLLTSDPVVEGIHAPPGTPGPALGHKALGRALSDIAAMGGAPLWALVDLSAPADTPVERLDGIYAGLRALADRHGVAIVGGDCGRAGTLSLHVFVVGQVPRGTAVTRAGGRPGDILFVTGRLGGSLPSGRHLAFEPRLAAGSWLRESGAVTAMCDLSDGLGRDLRRLAAASGTGAAIRLDHLPLHPDVTVETADPADGWRHGLGDGEDFELLLSVRADRADALEHDWRAPFPGLPLTRIGALEPAHTGLRFLRPDGQDLQEGTDGYEHFRSR